MAPSVPTIVNMAEAKREPAVGMTERDLLQRELIVLKQIGASHRRGSYLAAMCQMSGLVSFAEGTHVVVKSMAGAPAGLYRAEAEGLAALRATGCLSTPGVLAVTDRLLVLEVLASRDDSERSWERLAHDLAAVHRGTVHDRFGWHGNGYLGRVVQRNPWSANGHEFFVQHRLLRYLDEPLVQRELTRADRQALERFCGRLTEVIPVMSPVLTHGDLWPGNLLSGDDGRMCHDRSCHVLVPSDYQVPAHLTSVGTAPRPCPHEVQRRGERWQGTRAVPRPRTGPHACALQPGTV